MKFTRPFARMLSGLPPHPVIVEIGCAHAVEGQDSDSQGWSSVTFAQHVLTYGGELTSIDIAGEHVQALMGILDSKFLGWRGEPIYPMQGDGEAVIRELDLLVIDLLYVDGGVGGDIAAGQIAAAMPALQRGFGRVAFDDCPCDDVPGHWSNPEVRVSTVWGNPAAHGLELEWRDGVCASFRVTRR